MTRVLRSLLPVLILTFAVAATAVGAEAGAAHQQHSLIDLVWAGMPVEGILILLSLVTYSLALQWTFTIKRETLIPPGMADEIHNCFAEGVTDEAVENARNVVANDQSMLANILAAALDKKDFGYEAMKEAAEAMGVAEHNKYSNKVGWLSLFGSTATLLGLLGTVTGIIGSFLKMANHPGGVDANVLAGNIGEALVCTATGLAIAIGALMFFFMLRGRVNQSSLDAGVITTEVLDYFRPQH